MAGKRLDVGERPGKALGQSRVWDFLGKSSDILIPSTWELVKI